MITVVLSILMFIAGTLVADALKDRRERRRHHATPRLGIVLGPARQAGRLIVKFQLHSNEFIAVALVFAADSEGNQAGDPVTDAVFESSDPDVITVKTNDAGGVEFHAGPTKGTGKLGAATITVTSASLGLSGTIEGEVIAGAPSALNVSLGQPQPE